MLQLKNDVKQKTQQLETDRGRIESLTTQIADSKKGKEDSVSVMSLMHPQACSTSALLQG